MARFGEGSVGDFSFYVFAWGSGFFLFAVGVGRMIAPADEEKFASIAEWAV